MENQIQQTETYLRAYAMQLTRNNADADDLYQDTMFRVCKHIDKFQTGTNFKSWVMAIMRNTFINDYRKKHRRKTYSASNYESYIVNTTGRTTMNSGEANIAYDELLDLLDNLPRFFREPFWMAHEGYKYQEIAEIIDAPLGTIKSRIFFARQKLQKMYSNRQMLPAA